FAFVTMNSLSALYTLSLHDALPIWATGRPTDIFIAVDDVERVVAEDLDLSLECVGHRAKRESANIVPCDRNGLRRGIKGIPDSVDRKSTRLNSSHQIISYAVFCLKK